MREKILCDCEEAEREDKEKIRLKAIYFLQLKQKYKDLEERARKDEYVRDLIKQASFPKKYLCAAIIVNENTIRKSKKDIEKTLLYTPRFFKEIDENYLEDEESFKYLVEDREGIVTSSKLEKLIEELENQQHIGHHPNKIVLINMLRDLNVLEEEKIRANWGGNEINIEVYRFNDNILRDPRISEIYKTYAELVENLNKHM